MKRQTILAILGLIFFISYGIAMQEEDGLVTVSLWKPTDKLPHGHAALKTDERHHVSIYAEPDTEKGVLPQAISYMTSMHDEWEIGKPNETYTLRLRTSPINTLWEQLKEDATPHTEGFFIRKHTLNNVKYMISKPDASPTDFFSLYFSDTILVKGLLYAGGIQKIAQKLAYFQNKGYSGIPRMSSMYSSFDDIITLNHHVIAQPVSIDEIRELVKEAHKCQTLLEVEKEISAMKMTYLTTVHDQKIVDLVFKEDAHLGKVKAHLLELEEQHRKFLNDWSLKGFFNYRFGSEWKH